MEENLVLVLYLLLPVVAGLVAWLFFRSGRRHNSPASWQRLLAGNFLVLTFLLALIPPAGELYYRFVDDSTDSVAYTKGAKRWIKRHYVLNNAMVRDDVDYVAGIADGKRRITFVGDSFTAGHGISRNEDRFANRLRRVHPEWEVQLITGYGLDTGQEIAALEMGFSQHYECDLVVLVYCLNDIGDIMPEWREVVEAIGTGARQPGWLVRNSYFVSVLSYRWEVAHNPYMAKYFDFVLAGYRSAVWEEQKQRLRAARDLVQTNGGHFAAVTFPFLHTMGTNYEYEFIHDQLGTFWNELNVPHLDLLPAFRGFRPEQITVNRNDAHPNERANAIVAEQLDAFLGELVRRYPPPAPREWPASSERKPAAPGAFIGDDPMKLR